MSEINKINLSVLKSYEANFKSEQDNFINNTYSTFTSSYLNRCSDSYVRSINTQLDKFYKKIEKGYKNIDKWWVDYNDNVESLESSLANDKSASSISDQQVRNIVVNLPPLSDKTTKLINTFKITNSKEALPTQNNTKAIKTSNNFDSIYKDYEMNEQTDKTSKIGEATFTGSRKSTKSFWAENSGLSSELKYWWEYDAMPSIENISSSTMDVVNSVGATLGNVATSLVEGLSKFGESIVDFSQILISTAATPVTGIVDAGLATYGLITGKDWSSTTKSMWKDTQAFVAKDHVGNFFDKIYNDTTVGRWMKNDSYFGELVRDIGSGIGYIGGTIGLTIFTAGIGGALTAATSASTAGSAIASSSQVALTATVAGIGKNTERSWNDGAGILSGLSSGTLGGLWEGFQFYLGGKINELKLFGKDSLFKNVNMSVTKTKLFNSLSHVVLDGVDGGVEGIVMPLIDTIYKESYTDASGEKIDFQNESYIDRYKEVFDDNGGWSSIWTQAAIGGAASIFSEALDLQKYFKNSNISEKELQSKLDRLTKLENMKNSDEYLHQMSASDRTKIDIEYSILKKEIDAFKQDIEIKNISEVEDPTTGGIITERITERITEPLPKLNKLTPEEIRTKNSEIYFKMKSKEIASSTKKLSDLEIKIKREELDRLLESNELLKRYNEGEYPTFVIDEEFAMMMVEVDTLYMEIKTGAGKFKDSEQKLLEELLNRQKSNIQLKENLLKKVDNIDDPLLKARKLYMELNKKLHYSMEYSQASEDKMARIYLQDMTFKDLNESHTVICKGWSQLYKELLVDAGFDENRVKIMGTSDIGDHKWIEIDFDDKVLIADATNNINGSIDLAASKGGFATNGFLLLEKSFSGGSIRNMVKSNSIPEDVLRSVNREIMDADITLGYATKNGYLVDELTKSKELFNNQSLVDRIFNKKSQKSILDSILEMDVPEGIDGYEAYAYYKKLFKNTLGEKKDNLIFSQKFRKLKGRIEPSLIIEYDDDGISKFYLYSEGLGKNFFTTYADLQNFLFENMIH